VVSQIGRHIHTIVRTGTLAPRLPPFDDSTDVRVVVIDEVAEIEDLGSTNGTFVSEIAIAGPHQLRDADIIQVGP